MRERGRLVVRPPGLEGRFKKEWRFDKERRCLENKVLGVRYQVVDVVDEETGEFNHEGVILCSRRVELHVPVRKSDLATGFVFIRREKVIPPSISDGLFEKDPAMVPDPVAYATGIEEYELPHGLALKKFEEAEEETGYSVEEGIPIYHVKESPPLGGVAHVLYATVLGAPSGKQPDQSEQIKGFRFFPPEEVSEIETICGLTQSALWRARAWGLKQPQGSLWNDWANRI